MSLLKRANPAYLLAPRYLVQAEENAVMLREFNRIAREMLFLHGHLTRPRDWAENAPADAIPPAHRERVSGTKRKASLRTTAAACGVVVPRLVVGQFR